MKITILGSGSWATAIANSIVKKGTTVLLWTVEGDVANEINTNHTNEKYFPNQFVELKKSIRATTNLEKAIKSADLILNVIPTKFQRSVLRDIKDILKGKSKNFVNFSKGIEEETFLSLNKIFKEELGECLNNYATIVGPSHAEELIKKKLTFLKVASNSDKFSDELANEFSNDYLIIKKTKDIETIEFLSSIKNIYAIGSGILEGLGFGINTNAVFITKALQEFFVICEAEKLDKDAVTDIVGIGDLIVTATSKYSRNYNTGLNITKGIKADFISVQNTGVSEGYKSAKSMHDLIISHKLEMPLAEIIYQILYKKLKPIKLIETLKKV